ncbi:MAG: transposase [Tepidisphaeraceae bacterium]
MGKGYTMQFKEQAVRLITQEGCEPTQAARELGMPHGTLLLWLHKSGWPGIRFNPRPGVTR